jgi:hypothetical protein
MKRWTAAAAEHAEREHRLAIPDRISLAVRRRPPPNLFDILILVTL